jgi:hypothetical protein
MTEELSQSNQPTSDPSLMNSPEVRTSDGTLKDQGTPPDSTTKETKASTENSSEPEKSEGAPEKYEDFKLPEGLEINEKQMKEFQDKAKELNLSQSAAQSLIDFYANIAKETMEAPFKAYQEIRANWVKEVISDPTLGNGKDGLSNETRAAIGRVKDVLSADLRSKFEEAMDLTGAGDNPAFVRAMLEFSKRLTEGTPVKAGNPSTPEKKVPTTAQVIWPTLQSSAS